MGTPSLDFLPGVLAPQVVKASAAYRAGVRAGDIILGINGEALPPSARSVRRVVDVIRWAFLLDAASARCLVYLTGR